MTSALRRAGTRPPRSRAFARRQGGGFGIAKGAARALIRLRAGFEAREPLSGQRALDARARAAVFPLAPGFGAETRMTIDAVRAGVPVEEIELDLEHRATGRDLRGFVHRGRQLVDLLLAAGPLRVNYRGLRAAARRLGGGGARAGRRRDRARRRPAGAGRSEAFARTCARGARPAS